MIKIKPLIYTIFCILVSQTVTAAGNPDNQVIKTEKQLAEYCRYLIEQVYQATNKTTSNLQISSKRNGSLLISKIKYRVDDESHVAECQIKVGHIAKETEFSFVEK